MAPKYPWARNTPAGTSSSPNTTNGGDTTPTPNRNPFDPQPVVVSASGRAPNSPATGLTADSPSTLRARVASPRHPSNLVNDVFQSNTSSYPSPSDSLTRGKSSRKKNKYDGGKAAKNGGWIPLSTASPAQSPIRAVGVPRYDSRGYPARDTAYDPVHLSPESVRYGESSSGIRPSQSHDSLSSELSSTGAGVNEETGHFLSPERASHYVPSAYTHSQSSHTHVNPTPTSLYPPTLDYSLSAPSYSPYDNHHGNPNPLPSLYGDSRVSLASQNSGDSMTHFKQYDSLKDGGLGAFSISSKGGKRHLADMFSLPADPATWSYLGPEADDDFHDPDLLPSRKHRFLGPIMTLRGASNLGCLFLMVVILVMLFAGYPIMDNYLSKNSSNLGAYNLGGINATGQIPNVGPFQLIDQDTPASAYTWKSMETGDEWELVFSDEFNHDGRSFYDGDDPYWMAEDLHYWQTNNLEWYDPRQITTKDGSLVVTLTDHPSHNMNYTGGMMSTWNRFCFTGGYVEASVSLPGKSNVYGLWPAIWALGNLGRAGYGGTLDGMWPYTYDSCDVGTLPNQTMNGKPEIALTDGDKNYGYTLSYLPGQRLSRCTCTNDPTHPGPTLSNGTFVGRGAPEIDMFEATVDSTTLVGEVSQSGQWAPFNPHYGYLNTSSKYFQVFDEETTHMNTYQGSIYQQATSGLSTTDQNCYTGMTGCYSVYGFEYAPGPNGYITWVSDNKKVWTVRGAAMGPNSEAQVGQRLVSEEPMYLIVNLGISENFGAVDYEGLASLWPVTMNVDYIRVYQDPSARNLGCDPPNMPTAGYIAHYAEAYSNPNITTYDQISGAIKPKNILVDTC
ncbi:hypothetical protein CI109_105762 [Kwoniella shandongensis]|uniref:Uncharacterized protein n=1 Tax=Kwoniella shandongensis TaxID=1734106 RepID=A0A5M6C5W0_9TREE|nr:uncharacterized protein CI109_003101 [Kwoniella shandongensis]KAA5528569.1 hypothetical protein CI109_003101 [Kwoniella shandongensis]